MTDFLGGCGHVWSLAFGVLMGVACGVGPSPSQ